MQEKLRWSCSVYVFTYIEQIMVLANETENIICQLCLRDHVVKIC